MERVIALFSAVATFVITYSFNILASNIELYLAITSVILLDGFAGIMKAVKQRNFRTYRAINTVKKLFTWFFILTTTLFIEKGFPDITWIAETIVTPFMVLEFISALKNLKLAGIIKGEVLTNILKNIDSHKE